MTKAKAGTIDIHCAHDALVLTSTLVSHPRNPNQHPESQIKLLAKIIQGQGWRAPISVSTRSGFIVRGHGRLAAAQLLGAEEVPVDYQDYDTEAAEMADLVADNRITELSSMDANGLRSILQDLDGTGIDMEMTAFTPSDIESLMGQFDIDPIEPQGVRTGDGSGFQQMTFNLSDAQVFEIKNALDAAKADGPFGETGNENANGNALARIAEAFTSGKS